MLLGIAEEAQTTTKAAFKIFWWSNSNQSKNAQTHFNKNIALLNLGRKSEAEQALMRAKEMDPQILSKNGIQ